MRDVAQTIFTKIVEKYPHSFKGDELKLDNETPRDTYASKFAARDHFQLPDDIIRRYAVTPAEEKQLAMGDVISRRDGVDLNGLKKFEMETLSARPANVSLPWRLESYGRYQHLFLLDYGSYRDVQRHRNGVCPVPLLDGRYGMHSWYRQQMIDLLPTTIAEKLLGAINAQYERIGNLAKENVPAMAMLNQYLYPMGTTALVQVTYSVPQTAYVGELRSGKTVHPSLRPVAQKLLRVLAQDLPTMALHGDMDEDDWSAKRGDQTITGKTEAKVA